MEVLILVVSPLRQFSLFIGANIRHDSGGRPQKKQSGSGSGGGSSAGGKGSGRSPVAGPNGKAGTAGNAGGNGQPHAGNPGGLQRGGAVSK